MDVQEYFALLIGFICGVSVATLVTVFINGCKLDEIDNKVKRIERILNQLKNK